MSWKDTFMPYAVVIIIAVLLGIFSGAWLESLDSPFVDASTGVVIALGIFVIYGLASVVQHS